MHVIAAWEISEVEVFVRDRLFCHRTGGYVPYSLEEHSPSIKNDLSIKVNNYRFRREKPLEVIEHISIITTATGGRGDTVSGMRGHSEFLFSIESDQCVGFGRATKIPVNVCYFPESISCIVLRSKGIPKPEFVTCTF